MGMAEAQMGQVQRATLRPREGATGFTPPHVEARGAGFTLIELTIGASILLLAIVTLLGVFGRQSILNTHSRNLTWAMNDANRVLERLREQNSGTPCTTPSSAPPTGFLG